MQRGSRKSKVNGLVTSGPSSHTYSAASTEFRAKKNPSTSVVAAPPELREAVAESYRGLDNILVEQTALSCHLKFTVCIPRQVCSPDLREPMGRSTSTPHSFEKAAFITL
jgi:hypothetical protein